MPRRLLPILALLCLLVPALPPVTPAGAMSPEAGASFVTIQGDGFVWQGAPVRLKGTNYYPRDHAWARMWTEWDPGEVDRELGFARDLGMNVVRVLVPYEIRFAWTSAGGTVQTDRLDRLRQFVQIAGNHQLRVIITLFDWYDGGAAAGSDDERENLAYLRTIVSAFASDDRVLAWDLHNEPEEYDSWKAAPGTVVDWLRRLADAIRALDRNHPLTVGVARLSSLETRGSNGQTILGMSDFVSFHEYDAAAFASDIDRLRALTSKPIVLEEAGWPTGPACVDPVYSEPSQDYLYRMMLDAAEQKGIGGVVQWLLVDFSHFQSDSVDSISDHFGLLRTDYSWKPPAERFRSTFVVSPLPSVTTSSLTLRADPRAFQTGDGTCRDDPVTFVAGGPVLRCGFKYVWQQHGGVDGLGYTLTNEFKDKARDRIVQYFERGRLEAPTDTYKYVPVLKTERSMAAQVEVAALGQEAASTRQFPRVAADHVPVGGRYFPETGHTLAGRFRAFWESHGGRDALGLPLSEEVDEPSPLDGVVRTVQYFQFARLEYHPEIEGTGHEVQLGQLGREYLIRFGCLAAPSAAPALNQPRIWY